MVPSALMTRWYGTSTLRGPCAQAAPAPRPARMTYASDVREEVAHHPPADDCCRRALLGAALRGAGTLHLTGGGRSR